MCMGFPAAEPSAYSIKKGRGSLSSPVLRSVTDHLQFPVAAALSRKASSYLNHMLAPHNHGVIALSVPSMPSNQTLFLETFWTVLPRTRRSTVSTPGCPGLPSFWPWTPRAQAGQSAWGRGRPRGGVEPRQDNQLLGVCLWVQGLHHSWWPQISKVYEFPSQDIASWGLSENPPQCTPWVA